MSSRAKFNSEGIRIGSFVKKPNIIFSPEGNRRIRKRIAEFEDKITGLVQEASIEAKQRHAILDELGSFGDYLLDTDLRFMEELY
jgi:hypothetical protein